jgi:hypothetical protein
LPDAVEPTANPLAPRLLRRSRSPGVAMLLAGALLAPAAAPHAQEVGSTVPGVPAEANGAATAAGCPIGVISEIWVDNHSVFDLTDPNRSEQFDWAFRLANRLHIPTREQVIRRELLFEAGGCYDPSLLRESERALRASSFIAAVDIYGVQQPDGSYHVIVDTRDEWSTRVEPQTGPGTGLQVTGVAIREDNLLGTGRQASAFYLRSYDTRIYGVSYLNPQLFATRWQAGVAVGRTPLGSFFRETIEYPFVGESGRRAFRHRFEHHDRYFHYLGEQDGQLVEVLMPEQRRQFDLGAAFRFGPRGRSTLLGVMVVGDWLRYPGTPRVVGDTLTAAAPLEDPRVQPIVSRVETERDVSILALFGQRNVYFVRLRGLDTVNGVEDVRLGAELELGLGHSIGAFSSQANLSTHLGLSAAGQLGSRAVAGMRLAAEGKRNYDAPAAESEWDDVYAQLDLWGYRQFGGNARHTLVGTLAGSGGWNPRVPFQLTLGGATGLRGHPFHVVPGAQRLVAALEARSYLGWPHPELFDLGTSVFVDFGRIWAGDAPHGVDSGVYGNLGLGLRAAFPPESRNTYRIDIAAPLQGGFRFSDLVFSVGVGHTLGRSLRHDPELVRSARRGLTTSFFGVRSDREQ